MKYEFIKKDEDLVVLKYKDKELEFKTNVKTISEIQSLTAEARIRMIEDYASKGKSIKELVIETKKDGKTYFDNSNKSELEKAYQEKVTLEYFNNKCLELFKMDFTELMTDIGVEDEKESEKFAIDLMQNISGKSPRQ